MRRKITILLVLIISLLILPGFQPYLQTTTATQNATENYQKLSSLYRITPPLTTTDLPLTAEIAGGQPGMYHDVILSEESYTILQNKGYTLELLQDHESLTKPLDTEEYHTFAEMEQSLSNIASQYDNITSLFSIGKSYQNRDIWCIEITDNPGIDENEPGVLFLGLHHAREWPTLEITLHIAENLTKRYDTDPAIQNLIDNRRIWIVPCVNPDGYYYSYDEGNDWRKNRHYLEEFRTYGIDLNRNYGGSMNGNPLGLWGSTGMSHNPFSEVYCGANQFSELETQSVKQFFLTQDIVACISWHTFSELVMWPWGYSTEARAPNYEYMSEIGSDIASRITKQSGSGGYAPFQSAQLYPTTGDTADWMYGYSHYVLGNTCFTYTIEACSSFHPEPSELDQICKENMDGALYLLNEAQSISEIPERVIPPTINQIDESEDAYTICWNVTNEDHSTPLFYEIQELKNMFQYCDTAMTSPNAWDLNGFSSVSSRSYSPSKSYYSSPYTTDLSTMTTQYPIYVNESMANVSFYCWYDISEQWNGNKAFFEISTNGREYTVIDTFSGESNGWIRKNYSLEDYQGNSIYLQFRYAKTSNSDGEGFYVDDIDPVTYYYDVETLDDTIQQGQFSILKNNLEDSYFRIRGYNDEFGWGDWSQLVPLGEMNNHNNPPNAPVITGSENPKKGKTTTYTVRSIDPDEDDVSYIITWGDGTTEEWSQAYASGEEVTFSHTWGTTGDFEIKARAKDEHGKLSEWARLTVTTPKFKGFSPLWDMLLSYLSLFFDTNLFL